jgi:hypothetical protein
MSIEKMMREKIRYDDIKKAEREEKRETLMNQGTVETF